MFISLGRFGKKGTLMNPLLTQIQKNFGFKAMIFCLLLALTGCASVKESDFLPDYSHLHHGRHLEKVWVSPQLRRGEGMVIVVRKPTAEKTEDNENLPKEAAQSYFFHALTERLGNIPGIHVSTLNEPAPAAGKNYVLETGITYLDPGSRLLRIVMSGMMGHSRVQAEGKLIDPSTQEILLKFADRRAGSGAGGLDVTGGSSRQLLEADLDGIAKALAQTLNELP